MGYGANSDSVNDHRWRSSSSNVMYQLGVDNNGNKTGQRVAEVTSLGSSIDLNWTDTFTASASGYQSSDDSPLIWYGFES
jgi:hypothetical protein